MVELKQIKKEISKIVGEGLGEASMCWSEIPKGVFDSDHCILVNNRMVEQIFELIKSSGLQDEKTTN